MDLIKKISVKFVKKILPFYLKVTHVKDVQEEFVKIAVKIK
jgi:hypothetical protein